VRCLRAIETIIILLGLSFSSKVHAQNLYSGLVACYTFFGNANDGSGNSNDGTVHGATLTSDRLVTRAVLINSMGLMIILASPPTI